MFPRSFLFILVYFSAIAAHSQKIRYDVSFPNMVHHEAQISITLTENKNNEALFVISRSSPGRYDTHPFGRNIYNAIAEDEHGNALPVEQPHTNEYLVKGKHEKIKFTYTLFANHADGTYADIDPSAVLMNIPSCFIWVKNMDKAPIEVKFDLPAGKDWSIATQMFPTTDSTKFTAPGLQYFMDCPVLIGSLKWRSWEIKNPDGKKQTIRLAFNGNATDKMLDEFAGKLEKLTLEEQAVFGEVPNYDNGTYTFLYSVHPYIHNGDGMEHRNSTVITEKASFDGTNPFLSTFSHEFFHCWNVERIRPTSLEPFDFTRPTISEALWFAEGFTQYFSLLLLVRSGLISLSEFAINMNQWIDAKNASPAGKNFSPLEISRKAVFNDGATSAERTAQTNYYISYYYLGAAVALALDLELRTGFDGKSLDGYMKLLWQKFGNTEISYTVSGLQEVLASYTNADFAANFFGKYINAHERFDYKPLLAQLGFSVELLAEGQASMGPLRVKQNSDGLEIISASNRGTALYDAGLDIGDVLISADGKELREEADISQLLRKHKPGDKLQISYRHRNEVLQTTLILMENPGIAVFPSGGLASPTGREQKEKWLGSQVH